MSRQTRRIKRRLIKEFTLFLDGFKEIEENKGDFKKDKDSFYVEINTER